LLIKKKKPLSFPDGKVSSVNCWAWGRIVIPRELSSRDRMILYTAFHAQIVCAVPTELTIRDLHRQLDLLTEFDGCVILPMTLWACLAAADCISDIVIVSFFPFPSGGRAYTNFRGSKRILLKVSLIWLYIWIEFQGSGIFFCTRCQFRTKWQPFLLLCRKLFQNIHWQRWFHIWTSTCCVEQVDDWRAKMTNSCSFTPCLYINMVEYDISCVKAVASSLYIYKIQGVPPYYLIVLF